MKRFFILAKTEFKLSWRSPDVVLFALMMPVIILALIGLIYKNKAQPDGAGMLEMTFGAFLSIGICAIGLMALPLVLSDYRNKKVLKRLQVTPISPALLLGVQVLVQAAMALISALLVWVVAFTVFRLRPAGGVFSIAAAWLLTLAAIFSIGLVIASTARDIKQAGMLCSLAYFPMLLLSGTTVPFPVFPPVVRNVATVLPLRQGILLLNGVSQGGRLMDFPVQLVVLAGITLLGIAVSLKFFRWEMD